MSYLKNAARAVATPPQSEPLDKRQVPNSAGGYAYPVDKWVRMDRFLILGSEGGSYYATEQKLTKENLDAVAECVKEDGLRAVRRIIEISDAGRAPKNDPALLALAYAAGAGDEATRAFALASLPKVARIGTHLFHFVSYVTEFRGWGRALKNAIAGWYGEMDVNKMAEQVTKYQQRDGWSHASLLRLSHPHFADRQKHAIARWILGQERIGGDILFPKRELKDKAGDVVRTYPALSNTQLPPAIEGHVKLQACTEANAAAKIIREYGCVRESVPTELLKDAAVWDALLEKMPLTALIRNLGNMSKCGLAKPLSKPTAEIVRRLGDREALKKARVHPIQVLIAQKTYESGHGLRGSGAWDVVPQIVDALDEAYYAAFDFVEPTGKRYYLGLDISGSMWSGQVAGIPDFPPAVAAGAMAMVTVKTELKYYAAGFTTMGGSGYYGGMYGGGGGLSGTGVEMTPISLSPKNRLDAVGRQMQALSSKMGGTDCALPMLDALHRKLDVDVFAIYTDSETWHGKIHPMQALQEYRQKTGIPAKLVIVGMVANDFSIADPQDAGTMDCVGFDTATPGLIADFAKQ
jgi:60 kDa SS-A/Ro ribonucleoprotein